MSWYALSHGFLEDANRTNIWTPVRQPQHPRQPHDSTHSLGTATADVSWGWESPHARSIPLTVVRSDEESVTARLVVDRVLRAEMAEMARAMGRSEDDVWAEAAREWLLRRQRNDEPPPTAPAAAPVPSMRTRRLWGEIDEMLAELRQPRYVAAPTEPAVPAA